MLQKMTSLTAAIFLILAILAGCARSGAPEDAPGTPGPGGINPGTPGEGVADIPEYVYVSNYISLPEDAGIVNNIAYHESRLFFSASRYVMPDFENTFIFSIETSLYSVNEDGTELAALPGYVPAAEKPADNEGIYEIQCITADSEGFLWSVEKWAYYIYDLPDGFNAENESANDYERLTDSGWVLRKMAADGTPIHSIDISIYGWFMPVKEIAIQSISGASGDSSGGFAAPGQYIYLISGGFGNAAAPETVNILHSTDGFLFSAGIPGMAAVFARMPGGSIAVSAITTIGPAADAASRAVFLLPVDAAAQSLGEENIFEDSSWLFLAGGGSEGIDAGVRLFSAGSGYGLFFSNNESVYSLRYDNNEISRLLNWRESNISIYDIAQILAPTDEKFICLNSTTAGGRNKYEIIILNKTPRSAVPGKIVLTLAGIDIEQALLNAVFDFNSKNRDYHINIVDYAERLQNTPAQGSDYTRMVLDIISGSTPDLFAAGNLPFDDLASAGLFADLNPFIDNDSETPRSSLVQPPFTASEKDSRLFRVFSEFSIITIAGNPSVLGTGMGWDIDGIEAVLDANPGSDKPLGSFITGMIYLNYDALTAIIGDFTDRDTGTCSFDSPQFIKFLELAKRLTNNDLPAGNANIYDEEELIGTGRQIMKRLPVFDFFSLAQQRALFGGDLVFKGFPNSGKNGHLFLQFFNSLAISENSPHKEAAWSFAKTVLTENWQRINSYRFPTNQAIFDMRITEALDATYDNILSNATFVAVTQEDVDNVIGLINATTLTRNYEAAFYDIILEEAENYFNGTQSAADTARYIQSRASIFLAERN